MKGREIEIDGERKRDRGKREIERETIKRLKLAFSRSHLYYENIWVNNFETDLRTFFTNARKTLEMVI